MIHSNIKKAVNQFESLVEEGLVFDAAKLLGRAHYLNGTIVDGNRIGRTLGYPTANILLLSSELVIPAQGVYIAFAKLDGSWYKSMVNIGIRPTLNLERETIEAHLFNFDKQVYNHSISLHFIYRLRDEMRFASLAELKNQLDQDSERANAYFDKLAINPTPENDFVLFDITNSIN
jgi:riboflavin kinase/FMN adenylyltransferase